MTVTRIEPLRVELKTKLDRPGLVILADASYPGWRLTIDGRPAPILRANRMMRGAAVQAGEHSLIDTYDSWSFRFDLAVSLADRPGVPPGRLRQGNPAELEAAAAASSGLTADPGTGDDRWLARVLF